MYFAVPSLASAEQSSQAKTSLDTFLVVSNITEYIIKIRSPVLP